MNRAARSLPGSVTRGVHRVYKKKPPTPITKWKIVRGDEVGGGAVGVPRGGCFQASLVPLTLPILSLSLSFCGRAVCVLL